MTFRDLLETTQAIALSNRLNPTEEAVYTRYCREFSKRFSMSLIEVYDLNPEFVLTELFSDYLSDWDTDERMEDFLDLHGSLSDQDYDAKKERDYREQMRRILEEERLRVKEKRPIHESMSPKQTQKKEIPKSGGINMDLIKQLQNEEKESGKF